jgi:hypothetical protein
METTIKECKEAAKRNLESGSDLTGIGWILLGFLILCEDLNHEVKNNEK